MAGEIFAIAKLTTFSVVITAHGGATAAGGIETQTIGRTGEIALDKALGGTGFPTEGSAIAELTGLDGIVATINSGAAMGHETQTVGGAIETATGEAKIAAGLVGEVHSVA